MRNPLRKRLPKELKDEFAKFLVIFLFMTGTIGFISGFLVADNSMIQAYKDSFVKYNVEDGNFETEDELTDEQVLQIETNDVAIYKNYYTEQPSKDRTIRIFANRQQVNLVCLMKGSMPIDDNEIAIDRMFADNNDLSVGDMITVGEKELTISGLVALSDYSALFSNNTDMMFDAVKFGVGVMTTNGFASYESSDLHYNYSWQYNEPATTKLQEKEKADTFLTQLVSAVRLTNYIPAYENQAIQFTGNDMGNDKTIMITLLYILISIMAFVFAITTSNTITHEASVIGTLRASGYTKGELLRHYLMNPMIVSILSSIVGNILGYTVFKRVSANLYYSSYSLPTYVTIWNMEAFLLTTVVPFGIMFLINVLILVNKLSLSPLQFLRRDLKRKQKKKAIRLPNFQFFHRFRLRIILQNLPSYGMLFIGILFANVLLLFGMMMSPLLQHYEDQVLNNKVAAYQYILKVPAETSDSNAEKYCVTSLKTTKKGLNPEEVTIYGIEEQSKYIDLALEKGTIYISDGLAAKYDIKEGDTITLKEDFGIELYEFTVKGIYEYPAALSVFMDKSTYCHTFDQEDQYFNGYFSNQELSDLEEQSIATVITDDDLTKVSRQMDVSLGDMFVLVNVFAILLYMLLIYLLSKLIIEKNANAISMIKILGYENSEVGKLYLLSNTIVVVVATAVSLPIAETIIHVIYVQMMKQFTGWLTYYTKPSLYILLFIMGIVAYLVIAVLEYRKIRKIPMEDALKNVE
ncbi:ABC transporter permease [Anaerosporobacter faecicola]|uniref:ABC transporter permease n=1 Tax=Anaerosporobacter faecicola TaxID=2718714 RepID=UPI00143A7E8F|nr:ABC transporter permease [Anaerosporobacter faecicola]